MSLLITGRSGISDIERHLQSNFQVAIQSREDDVRIFIRENLRLCWYGNRRLVEWLSRGDFEIVVNEAILPRLSGSFLLARLYVDILAHQPTIRDVRTAMQKLPDGRESTYANALERICSQEPHQAELGRKVLGWIICAARPLNVRELQYGLAIQEGDRGLDPEGLLETDYLTSFCAGLVVQDKESNLLSLVHSTAFEYFTDQETDLVRAANESLAVACVTHLLMDTFENEGACVHIDAFIERCTQNPFFRYCAANWGTHVRISFSLETRRLSTQLVQSKGSSQASFQALAMVVETRLIPNNKRNKLLRYAMRTQLLGLKESMPAVHFAAYFGLVDIVQNLLESGSSVNEYGIGGTPLHWAIMGKRNEMLQFLLEHGADVNAARETQSLPRWWQLDHYLWPLHLAASLGDAVAISHLSNHAVDLNRLNELLNEGPCSAFTVALKHGHTAVAELLLSRGANLDKDRCSVEAVIVFEWPELLGRVLKGGVGNFWRQYALACAAACCDYDKMMLLIEAETAISLTTEQWNTPIVKADAKRLGGLSEEDKDMAAVGSSSNPLVVWSGAESKISIDNRALHLVCSETSLMLVAQKGEQCQSESLKCANCLIDAGANLNLLSTTDFWADQTEWVHAKIPFENDAGSLHDFIVTPLITAAYLGDNDMIRLLAERGADVYLDVGRGHTALVAAVRSETIVLERRQTGLAATIRRRHEPENSRKIWKDVSPKSSLQVKATLELLINLGADPNTCVVDDETRIDQLVNLSSTDYQALKILLQCKSWEALQTPTLPQSYHQTQGKLKTLVIDGASSELYRPKEKNRLEEILRCPDGLLDALDEARQRYLHNTECPGLILQDGQQSTGYAEINYRGDPDRIRNTDF